MVSIFAFDPTWAIFFRRNEMYASTLLSLALDEGPQARLISCSFESTAPGEPSRMRAMANSFCDRRMDSSPQVRIHGFKIQREIAHGERLEDDIALAPREGAQAGQQLGGGEGLGHVVVGAGVVAADFVAYGIAGGEQQNGRAHMRSAQALGHGEAVGLR